MLKSLRSLFFILIIVLGLFVYLYLNPSDQHQTDLLKTLISTILGGLVTVFITLRVNTFNSQQKSAIEKKKDIYIPITEELKAILNDRREVTWVNLTKDFYFPEIDKQLERTYVFLPKKLLKKLNNIRSLAQEFKSINHYSIAKDIILDNFQKALNDCCEPKKSEKIIRDYAYIQNPYELLEEHLNHPEIDRVVDDLDNCIKLYDHVLINYHFIFQLDILDESHNYTNGAVIANFYDFKDKLYSHETIILKIMLYNNLLYEIQDSLEELNIIFQYIHKSYENDKY